MQTGHLLILPNMEYLEGYPENEVPGGAPSFNTYTLTCTIPFNPQ